MIDKDLIFCRDETLEDILRFLQVDDAFRPAQYPRSNVSYLPRNRRLHRLFNRFEELIAAWDVQVVILEDVFVLPKYPKASLQLGAVIGVFKLAASMHDVEVMELKPREVKIALTGNGRASKSQVARSVGKVLRLPERITSDHASDALALALVGLSRSGLVRW